MAYGYIVDPEPKEEAREKYSARYPVGRGRKTKLCKRPRIRYVCGIDGKQGVRVRVVAARVHDRHIFRPLTTRPPSYLRTFHPSSSSALLTAGPKTPMPFAECVPRPVMILSGFAETNRVSILSGVPNRGWKLSTDPASTLSRVRRLVRSGRPPQRWSRASPQYHRAAK